MHWEYGVVVSDRAYDTEAQRAGENGHGHRDCRDAQLCANSN